MLRDGQPVAFPSSPVSKKVGNAATIKWWGKTLGSLQVKNNIQVE